MPWHAIEAVWAVPLAHLQADPDGVEEAVQAALARQSFWAKSSEQELMQ